ncbi:alpha/beta fold hydrolase [Kribbella sp. CA-253562]|uniref:alpha/beta fold hydrolase n=1 Tax=Kribbella sp. CA-253562 TaxID=3239942 RepID=UPI003D8F9F08
MTVHRTGDPEAPPILLLHGAAPGASGLSNWRSTLHALSDRYYCLAPDFIGFADSWHPTEPPRTMVQWNRLRVQQALEVLDHYDIAKSCLVGSSMGAAVALQLLSESPDRFDRAALLASAGLDIPVTRELQRVMDFYLDASPAALAAMYKSFVYDTGSIPVDVDALAATNYPIATRPEVRRSFEAQFASGPPVTVTDSALRRISHPVLVVHGVQDPVVPVDAAFHLGALLPDVRIYLFGQCGHWIPVEYPDELHALLAGFFASGESRASTENG